MRFSGRSPSKRVSARIRTRPLKGLGDDAGRFYRCSHCGFLCDLERDRFEGDNAIAGNDTEIVITASSLDGAPTNSAYSSLTYTYTFGSTSVFGTTSVGAVAVLSGDLNFFHTTMEEGPDGDPKPIYHAFQPIVSYGCPFCGTTNWKGK